MPSPERLSASVAAKHIGCHASANLELAIPGYQPPPKDGATAASTRGSILHELMEQIGGYTAREMRGIAQAIDYVAGVRARRRFKVKLEAPGKGWWLKSQARTTADVLLYVQDELHVIDYKFGKIPVEAYDNDQGKYYALSFLDLAPKATGVSFHIVQPFADNFDEVFFTLEELDEFRLATIAAEQAIANEDVTFTPGDHCQFCPANPHSRGAKGSMRCPAMVQLLYPPPPLDEDALLDLM